MLQVTSQCVSFHSPMWYSPIQSLGSTSSLMSQKIMRLWACPNVYSYMLAVKLERLSEVTRSVSLLARWRVMFSGMELWAARLCRFSGLSVYRIWGFRRRTKSRCSRAELAIPAASLRSASYKAARDRQTESISAAIKELGLSFPDIRPWP